jgi:hypothetical protein
MGASRDGVAPTTPKTPLVKVRKINYCDLVNRLVTIH